MEKRSKVCNTKGNVRQNHDHPDAAPSIQYYLIKCKIKILPHPPYNPDLVAFDFLLLSTLQEKFRARKFNMESNVISTVQDSLKQLPKKASFLVLESGLNDGTVADHLKKVTLKKNDFFFWKCIF